jgi:hypothetical protein
MKRLFGVLAVTVLLGSGVSLLGSGSAFTPPSCLQDNYGNQYQYLFFNTLDQQVFGIVNNVQCPTDILSMIGSWTVDKSNKTVLEFTVANNTGSAAVCVQEYELKGVYPSATWYYPDGANGATFNWAQCSTDAAVTGIGKGGALGPERQ